MKREIIQAMTYGLPTVATSLGMDGLQMVHGVDVMVGDSPVIFADQVVQLYTNCNMWEQVVSGGYKNLNRNFSPLQAQTQLLIALAEAGLPPRGVNAKHHC